MRFGVRTAGFSRWSFDRLRFGISNFPAWYFLFKTENLVLPPGCKPYPPGWKLGQVRDDRLCHRPSLFMVSGVSAAAGQKNGRSNRKRNFLH
jgi:hypothetical protein